MAALAEPADVAARLGRALTTDESVRVPGLLDEASASVRAWMRCVPNPVPDDVALVVSRMVARALESAQSMQHMDVPYGTSQMNDSAGQVSMSRTFSEGVTSGSPWLTKDDKRILRGYGCRGRVMSFETR